MNNLYKNKTHCSNSNEKISFKQRKDNALNSIYEVEYFLRNLQKLKKYSFLYKILK